MPHITLIYPFLPKSKFASAARELGPICRSIPAFEVTLGEFGQFGHGKGYYTIWLAPEPEDPLLDLHAELWGAVGTDEFGSGLPRFQPHLSVGQVRGMANMIKTREELQSGWTPIRFRVDTAHLIWRNDPPDDVFRVGKSVPLSG